jgi:predicted O-methyltransferase YrrM
MEFIDDNILKYCEKNTLKEDKILEELSRYTHLNVLSPRMLSGHLQGSFLTLLSKIIRPKNILEIGTYTGYSAICLAQGIQEGGKLITIDRNEELEDIVKFFLNKAQLQNKVQMMVGDAKEIIPNLKYNWDLVFIDADKEAYIQYFDLVIDKLNSGGIIIADNVLWSGKILEQNTKDKSCVALQKFNEYVCNDERVENVLLPIRDGLNVIRKK